VAECVEGAEGYDGPVFARGGLPGPSDASIHNKRRTEQQVRAWFAVPRIDDGAAILVGNQIFVVHRQEMRGSGRPPHGTHRRRKPADAAVDYVTVQSAAGALAHAP